MIDSVPQSSIERAEYLNSLACQLWNRFHTKGVVSDLEEAIQSIDEAIRISPHGSQSLFRCLSTRGALLYEKYSVLGGIEHLEEATRCSRESLNSDSQNDDQRASRLSNLAVQLNELYSVTGDMSSLEESVSFSEEAVMLTCQDDPNRPPRLNNLGGGLHALCIATGSANNLERSIKLTREAVQLCPVDRPERIRFLNNLGARLNTLYIRMGEMGDLDESIQLGWDVLEATRENHPDRASRLSNLGVRLSYRYQRIGAESDLESAIRLSREAVRLTLDTHFSRAQVLNNLGARLNDRYLRTGAMDDLNEAIGLGQQAIIATPKGHPDLAGRMGNLGARLSSKYSKSGAIEDLNEAIEFSRKAVHTSLPQHPEYSKWLNNLGVQLYHRYTKTNALGDLDEAVEFGRRALKTTPQKHTDRAGRWGNLAARLNDQYFNTGDKAKLDEAILNYDLALKHDHSPTIIRILSGRELMRCYASVSNWEAAHNAANFAVSLMTRLTPQSLENSSKQHVLSQVAGIALDAAALAIQAKKEPIVALKLLEQGRGVLATSIEELRTDILQLRDSHPSLADRLLTLRDQLDASVTENVKGKPESSMVEPEADIRYKAGKEFDSLIAEIRKQSGFETFLLAPRTDEILDAAIPGPIIFINVSSFRCDAIVVQRHSIRTLALPKLKLEVVKEMTNETNLERVLKWMWEAVANPVLHVLGFTTNPSNQKWPSVWWILTGPLSTLPIHAAGIHGTKETVLDRVISSYSSSVKALIYTRRSRLKVLKSANALLVAMENTPGYSRLPFAADEVEILNDLCRSMALNPIQPKPQKALKDTIMSQILQCQVFHFAGHGHTDRNDPSKSHLILGNNKNNSLTVADLLRINLRRGSPFLAYLSACGTGQIGEDKFRDESIHLISAFQLAGFRHVIGTLWEVNDESCVNIAKVTYETMKDEGMSDESVRNGLHKATTALRDDWLNNRAISGDRRSQTKRKSRHMFKNIFKVRAKGNMDSEAVMSSRNIILEETDTLDSLHWVPYVHFGV